MTPNPAVTIGRRDRMRPTYRAVGRLALWLSFFAVSSVTALRAFADSACTLPVGVDCDDPVQWKQHAACACIDLRYADPRFFAAFERWKKEGRSPQPDKGVWGWESKSWEDQSTVAVTSKSNHGKLCSGVLISSKAVLTAGHCVAENIGITGDIVQFGLDIRNLSTKELLDLRPKELLAGGSVVNRTVSRVLHQQYDEANTVPDFAILLLNEKAPVQPVQIAAKADVDAAIVGRAVGFGLTEQGTVGRKVFVELILVSKNCEGSFVHKYTGERMADSSAYDCLRGRETVAAGFVDVGSPRVSSDTCDGDSGGPLLVSRRNDPLSYLLVGITARAVDSSYFPTARLLAPNGQEMRCGSGGVYTTITPSVLKTIVVSLKTANETVGK